MADKQTTPKARGIARKLPADCPQRAELRHAGKTYAMTFERGAWRLRCRRKGEAFSHNTGCHRLDDARTAARQWLETRAASPMHSRRGGGTLAALAAIYLDTPKRTKAEVARDNVSRLRSVCRLAIGRDLDAVTCREVGPELWEAYQRAALERAGYPFDLTTRRRENLAINAAVRAARCLFLPALLPRYRAAGLDVRPDAGAAVMLPEPYVPPAAADDAALVAAWRELPRGALWAAIGLARFAGLRRDEIAACRHTWVETRGSAVVVVMRDRPEENWWTKTGRPYVAQVIDDEVAQWILERREGWTVPDPPDGSDRGRWFEREPQRWCRQFVAAAKPLHRLRGLYADHVAAITADAVAARLAGIRAAQEALGHTSAETTTRHYLTADG